MTSELRFEYDFSGYPVDFTLAIQGIERDFRTQFGRSIVGYVEDVNSLDADLWIVTGWFIPIEGRIAKGTITVVMDLEGFQGLEQKTRKRKRFNKRY